MPLTVIKLEDVTQGAGLFCLNIPEYKESGSKELRQALLEQNVQKEEIEQIIGRIGAIFDTLPADEKKKIIRYLSMSFGKSASGSEQANVQQSQPTLESLDGVTPEQLAAWRKVESARSRAYRSRMTSEQAADLRSKVAQDMRNYRSQLSPEQVEDQRAKARERMRAKRRSSPKPQE